MSRTEFVFLAAGVLLFMVLQTQLATAVNPVLANAKLSLS